MATTLINLKLLSYNGYEFRRRTGNLLNFYRLVIVIVWCHLSVTQGIGGMMAAASQLDRPAEEFVNDVGFKYYILVATEILNKCWSFLFHSV